MNGWAWPVKIHAPEIIDNAPPSSIHSNMPDLIDQYQSVPDHIITIDWNVTDLHENTKTCTTRIIRKGELLERLNFMRNVRFNQCTLAKVS